MGKETANAGKEIHEQSLNELVKLAVGMGALDAKLIDSKDIVVRDWVRLKCQYGCGMYGKSLACPPRSPSPEQMRQILSGYSSAILMRLPDESMATHDMIAKLERSIFLKGYYRAFGLPAGPCNRCEKCNLEHCAHPRLARPSLEACGIDVYATARKNGFSIDVRKTRREKPTYFGLVLLQ
jgi:predicted metal-binding protein